MSTSSPTGLYVHFPWCVRKCPYCDFNSHPLKADADFTAYGGALIDDWRAQTRQFDVDVDRIRSIFFGGGTPSLFPPDVLAHVLSRLGLTHAEEVTMEANPGTTEHADFSAYRNAGINRLSLGAQSFNDVHLNALGRIHRADETRTAFDNARRGGFANINLDLMWGLPGQTLKEALDDLDAAMALQPEHISWYQLTIEPKTEFARRPPQLPVEDEIHRIEQAGKERLAQRGFIRYEVSAYAQADRQCRHNLNYWTFGDYLGVGAGAHGKLTTADLQVRRTRKTHQPRVYQRAPTLTQVDDVEAASLPLEFMMNALRLIEGVPRSTFEARTGVPWSEIDARWQRLVDKELVHPERIATTTQGLRFLDSVVGEFV